MNKHSNHNPPNNTDIKLTKSLAILREAATATEAAIGQARLTLADMDDVIDRKSPTAFRMSRMMGDASHAARSIRALVDYLESNPSPLTIHLRP